MHSKDGGIRVSKRGEFFSNWGKVLHLKHPKLGFEFSNNKSDKAISLEMILTATVQVDPWQNDGEGVADVATAPAAQKPCPNDPY